MSSILRTWITGRKKKLQRGKGKRNHRRQGWKDAVKYGETTPRQKTQLHDWCLYKRERGVKQKKRTGRKDDLYQKKKWEGKIQRLK